MNFHLKQTAAVALALGTLVSSLAMQASAQELTKINLIQGASRVISSYPVIVAEALGYFKDEGIDFNLLPTSEKVPFVAFLSNGQADIAKLDTGSIFSALDVGVPVKVIYESMQYSPDGIQVPASSDIQSIADLKGKTLGLVSDRDLPTAELALKAGGMTIDDVTTVIVGEGGPVLARALNNKQVDGIVGSMTDWAGLLGNGIELRDVTPKEMAAAPANSFVVSAKRYEELKPVLGGFLRAWAKASEAGKLDPETVAMMVEKVSPQEFEDPAYGRAYLGVSVAINTPITPQYGELQTDVWTKVQSDLVANDMLSQTVDVSSFLDASLIPEANDFDREQIKADLAEWKAANQ